MSISERQQQILQILSENSFVTVQELSELTYISPSSIRRDLKSMQNSGLVQRTHGGVTLPEPVRGVPSFQRRRTKSVTEKRIIAKKASALLHNGQSILLDGSSTVTFLLPYIARCSGVRLFVPNLYTALSAIEYGIDTCCLGGRSLNGSAALAGPETCRALEHLHADLLFFSSQSLDAQGIISDSTEEQTYLLSQMLHAAKKRVFLCDSAKFDSRSLYTLGRLDSIDLAVFDRDYPELKHKCEIL